MSTSLDSSPRVADVLDAVRALAPGIRTRAAEVESARRVPLDLLDDLKAAGCFGLLLPRTHGGAGSDLAGRDAGVRGAEPGRRVGRLDHPHRWWRMARPRRAAAGDLRRPCTARVASPSSPGCSTRPEPQSRWRAVTRSTAGGRSRAGASTPTGSTETASTRRAANRNSGSWSSGPTRSRSRTRGPSSGLRGTGSHHFNSRDVVVPAERTVNVFADPPSVDSPLHEHPRPRQPRPAARDRSSRHRPGRARRRRRPRDEQGATAVAVTARREPAVPVPARRRRREAARGARTALRGGGRGLGDRDGRRRVHPDVSGATAFGWGPRAP